LPLKLTGRDGLFGKSEIRPPKKFFISIRLFS
jgi:hypothetical protein